MIKLDKELSDKFIATYITMCSDELKDIKRKREEYEKNKQHVLKELQKLEHDILLAKANLSAHLNIKQKKYKIPEKYAKLIENVYSILDKEKLEDVDVLVNRRIQDSRGTVNSLIHKRKDMIHSVEKLCRDMEVFESLTKKELLDSAKGEQTERAEKEIEFIENLPFIKQLVVGDDRFVFFTEEVKLGNPIDESDHDLYNLGSYYIRIYHKGMLGLESARLFDKGCDYSYDHSHVNKTKPCLGNVEAVMMSLLKRKNIADVLLLSWNFLHTHVEGGAYIKWDDFITAWKSYDLLKVEER